MINKWIKIFLLIFLTTFVVDANSINFESNGTSQGRIKFIDYRLPRSIRPSNYEITLNFSPELSFRGSVKIKATVQENTNKIVLHYGKLNIIGVSVLHKKKQLIIQSTDYNPITEKYSIVLKNVLSKEMEILVAIVYTGEAHDDLRGFYKMTYFNKKGAEKQMAATQFSPIFARHAFPCFDEPAFKALFKIRIRRPLNYIALSNMPLSRTKTMATSQIDIFEESVKMSTYLVGFVIGDLSATSKDRIKVWTREDVKDQTQYAQNVSKSILETLESLFKQPFQISKLDLVALPQMYFTAMENWGLITFRESALLYDKKDSSVDVQKTVAETIAHECTHMWFGNLVTPDWWGYLWLKEAFAGYYESRAIDMIEPMWRMKEQILLNHQNALLVDSLPLTKPISRNVDSPAEVMDMFDRISYKKGLSIIRMMDLSFGTENLDSALLLYLQSKRNKSSKPEDLFASLQLKVNPNRASVETIMNSWTEQSGYPVLSVTVNKNHAKLSQRPFSLEKENTNFELNKKWWLPISWITKSTPSSVVTIDRWINADKNVLLDKQEDDWVIFNVQAAGFYRVNYDTLSWQKIIQALNGHDFTNVPTINRAAIIDDLLNLARANLVDYTLAFEGLNYLKQETNYLPFKTAFNALDHLTRKLSGQQEFSLYTKYLTRLLKNIHLKVGFNDKRADDMTAMLLRRELNWMLCNLDHQDCVQKSLNSFDKWKNGVNARVPRNLKTVVYATAIKKGSADNWQFLWNKYNETNIVSEQMEIFNALSCSPNSEILDKHLRSFLFKSSNHRMYQRKLNDFFSSILSCSLFGTEFVVDFIDNNYQEILKFNGNNVEQISSILLQVSEYLSTQTLIDKFEAIIQSHYIDFQPVIFSLNKKLEFAKQDFKMYLQNSRKIMNWLKYDNDKSYSENVNYIISE
ncbi:aminopeptidase N-like [Leptopilina heterotoma]|uniref:aminopeptidase N-like n=1 Tax=Leptopilina heterotoma TaxID=63436 RepID=UPI001CA90812|nr:aminopeptidase N-like [Leptopilina heterotoma]